MGKVNNHELNYQESLLGFNMSSSDSATRSLPVLSLRAAEIASAAAQKKAQDMGIGA